MAPDRRPRGALAVSAAVLLGLAWLLRSGHLSRSDKLSVASLVVGLAGVLLALPQSRAAIVQLCHTRMEVAGDAALLDWAAEQLVVAVQAQWDAEAGLRSLRRPEPLRLAWRSTTRPVTAPAHTITGATVAGRVVRLRLHGQLDEVADKYLALPHRRLALLGAPGAGKTVLAMLFTLKLLARRRDQPDDPVPVLLTLSSWDPDADHLHTWLARRLGEDYPALASRNFGANAAARLVISGRVLPVLDGLDELPDKLRARAIGELDRACADRPLVLTCRAEEFEQAVAGGGPLAAALVVELEPVTAEQAASFLRTTAVPAMAARWDLVADHLHAAPDGELAAALSTPLMGALARTVYATPASDSAELVGLGQAGERVAVEGHLLDGFIPAAYSNPPAAPGIPAPARRWDPELATRWLRVLAVHLRGQHTPRPGLVAALAAATTHRLVVVVRHCQGSRNFPTVDHRNSPPCQHPDG